MGNAVQERLTGQSSTGEGTARSCHRVAFRVLYTPFPRAWELLWAASMELGAPLPTPPHHPKKTGTDGHMTPCYSSPQSKPQSLCLFYWFDNNLWLKRGECFTDMPKAHCPYGRSIAHSSVVCGIHPKYNVQNRIMESRVGISPPNKSLFILTLVGCCDGNWWTSSPEAPTAGLGGKNPSYKVT